MLHLDVSNNLVHFLCDEMTMPHYVLVANVGGGRLPIDPRETGPVNNFNGEHSWPLYSIKRYRSWP